MSNSSSCFGSFLILSNIGISSLNSYFLMLQNSNVTDQYQCLSFRCSVFGSAMEKWVLNRHEQGFSLFLLFAKFDDLSKQTSRKNKFHNIFKISSPFYVFSFCPIQFSLLSFLSWPTLNKTNVKSTLISVFFFQDDCDADERITAD